MREINREFTLPRTIRTGVSRNKYTFLCRWVKKKIVSEVPVLSQPVSLRGKITVNDITLLILERPWRDDQDISFTDPDPFLDLTLDPAHAGDTIITPHTDMVCPHHKVCKSELFIGPFFG